MPEFCAMRKLVFNRTPISHTIFAALTKTAISQTRISLRFNCGNLAKILSSAAFGDLEFSPADHFDRLLATRAIASNVAIVLKPGIGDSVSAAR
jgi:hypothetical protein